MMLIDNLIQLIRDKLDTNQKYTTQVDSFKIDKLFNAPVRAAKLDYGYTDRDESDRLFPPTMNETFNQYQRLFDEAKTIDQLPTCDLKTNLQQRQRKQSIELFLEENPQKTLSA